MPARTDPQLNDKPILTGSRLLRRWHALGTAGMARVAERVELIGGDRLTGSHRRLSPRSHRRRDSPGLLGRRTDLGGRRTVARRARAESACRCDHIRRVVWDETTYRPYRPGAFFYRDGRRTTFRSIRWSSGSLRLLLEQGVEEVAWEDAAEVHLPERDPWDEYVDKLAVLLPDGEGRLVRFETPGPNADHRLAAASAGQRQRLRCRVAKVRRSSGVESRPDRDSAAVAGVGNFFRTARSAAVEVRAVGLSCIARSWPAVGTNGGADLNVQGGTLAAGEREFGWGFGVHAYAALQFDLPPTVRYFRTSAALDRAAGNGGTVRGRIYFGPTQTAENPVGKPLAETPVLIGSTQVYD